MQEEQALRFLSMVSRRMDQIAERKTGEDSRDMQIAELYIESEDLRREAYNEIVLLNERLQASIVEARWMVLIAGVVIYSILK